MKNISFSVFNVVSVVVIVLVVFLIICPFEFVNVKQAQRIAKWLNEYEKISYSFDLAMLHENSIIPEAEWMELPVNEDLVIKILAPYLNLESDELIEIPKYKYRMLNSKRVDKSSQFYFNRFVYTKNGILLSVKKRQTEIVQENRPLYYMLVDINGTKVPNRIGQDIFFINIYKNRITSVGYGEEHAKLKANCSPIGTGIYCSEYYLYGGSL